MDTRAPELLIPQLLLSSESEAAAGWLTATPNAAELVSLGRQASGSLSGSGRQRPCSRLCYSVLQWQLLVCRQSWQRWWHIQFSKGTLLMCVVIFSTLLPVHTHTPHPLPDLTLQLQRFPCLRYSTKGVGCWLRPFSGCMEGSKSALDASKSALKEADSFHKR